MADHVGMQSRSSIAAHVQERSALRGAKPLVRVARVIGRTELRQIQRHHARSVRTIRQGIDSARGQLVHQPPDGQDQRRRARDMVEQRQSRPRRHSFQHRSNDFLVIAAWERQIRHHHSRPGAFGDEIDRLAAGAIGVRGEEQFIVGLERE